MSYYTNVGYHFPIPPSVTPQGSILPASAMPAHQLLRRHIDSRYPHMQRLLFDPQLYLAGLDAASSSKRCANLATYPWFGVQGFQNYESSEYSQSSWSEEARRRIPDFWTRSAPSDVETVQTAVRDCIAFQLRLGCEAIILPSPLTVDPSSAYVEELLWLDTALEHLDSIDTAGTPVFATVALADICVKYTDPPSNELLNLVLDNIGAREVDGVYLIVEQGSEPDNRRHCTSTRTLWSVLELCHQFSQDCDLQVGVNFFGAFGLACEAAGANFWSSGWYKSEYRFRLADGVGGGLAYPTYWSLPSILDINIDRDFDRLNESGLLPSIEDETEASEGLLRAAREGRPANQVDAWTYRPSNVGSAKEHFYLSVLQQDITLESEDLNQRREQVSRWFEFALATARSIETTLGSNRRTNTDHVQAWHDAFNSYLRNHNF